MPRLKGIFVLIFYLIGKKCQGSISPGFLFRRGKISSLLGIFVTFPSTFPRPKFQIRHFSPTKFTIYTGKNLKIPCMENRHFPRGKCMENGHFPGQIPTWIFQIPSGKWPFSKPRFFKFRVENGHFPGLDFSNSGWKMAIFQAWIFKVFLIKF